MGASPSTRRRSGVPGPRRCCCPTTSSSVRGRIRTASGATAASARSRASSNSERSTPPTLPARPTQQMILIVLRLGWWRGVDAGLAALGGGDRRRRAGEGVLATTGLGERDDVAQRLGPGEEHADAVPAERDAAVGWGAEAEGVEQEA